MRFKGQDVFSFLLTIGLLSSCGGGSGGSGTNPGISNVSSSSSIASSQSSSSTSPGITLSPNNLTQCELLNFNTDETISYKLPILFGRCPASETTLDVEVAGKTYTWPIVDGYFKGAVLLKQGANDIHLNSDSKAIDLKLNYEPSNNPNKVQLVYAIGTNDDGHFFAAPGVVNNIESAKKRMALQGLMMQSATAEMMFKALGKRITYTLVEDENGEPAVNIFQVSQTRDVLYKMDGLDIYSSILDQLKTEEQNTYKYMVNMGFSSYENGRNLAHTALGGGNLALFGSLHFHACPETIDDISASFSNAARIDTSILPDDSAGRGTYWANCATGMGASLHELGHAFGLPHTDYGIMMRGFDLFNRLFMITEPGFLQPLIRNAEYDAVWHPNDLQILFFSPWIPQ